VQDFEAYELRFNALAAKRIKWERIHMQKIESAKAEVEKQIKIINNRIDMLVAQPPPRARTRCRLARPSRHWPTSSREPLGAGRRRRITETV